MKVLRSGQFLFLVFVILASALVWAAQTSHAHGDRMTDFSIEAQPLQKALLAFSEQAGVQLIIATDTAALPPCDGLRGRMSARRAIEALLVGSGLEFHFSSQNTVTVRRPVLVMPGLDPAGTEARKSAPPPQ